MGEVSYCEKARAWLNTAKPCLLALGLQFAGAGLYIISMDAVKKGMSLYVFIVYRNIIAVITLGPFAAVLEREVRPKMTLRIFTEIMALAFFEVVLDQCITLSGMKLTSASFASAALNAVPSITFVLAVLLRLEPLKIKEIQCQAKMIGTLTSFGGALFMTLYKGPVALGSLGSHVDHNQNVNDPRSNQWVLGTFFLLIGGLASAGFYILQAITLKKYPAEMSLSTWICFMGAFESLGVALYAERHHPYAWSVGWNSKLIAPFYGGIVSSGLSYYVQGLVVRSVGPVVMSAFSPLRTIIVTGLALFFLSEQLYFGRIIGAIIVVLGLYLIIWGKYKELKARTQMSTSPAKEISSQGQDHQQLPITTPRGEININNNDKAQLVTTNNNGDENSDVEARN